MGGGGGGEVRYDTPFQKLPGFEESAATLPFELLSTEL